ncbi:MAG TPA: hypothetical protein VJ721_07235 [Chthoniobacterales bacterium]|nr:hypothetical protein [Chthoniobacterales bacterium]
MKITLFSVAAAVTFAFSSATFAAEAKDYQVTGPVLEVNSSMIAVQKGKDRWELGRDSNTKASAEPKVGDKVTVHYTMTATNIEVKAAKTEKAAKKEAKATASPKK